ncbi:MAG: hypothetical protein LBC56_00430 [Oscillospiraceae bacterium]|nr:hypothetical protein [Oscillospiraceae bacterium]
MIIAADLDEIGERLLILRFVRCLPIKQVAPLMGWKVRWTIGKINEIVKFI